jgi:hypothetical protein
VATVLPSSSKDAAAIAGEHVGGKSLTFSRLDSGYPAEVCTQNTDPDDRNRLCNRRAAHEDLCGIVVLRRRRRECAVTRRRAGRAHEGRLTSSRWTRPPSANCSTTWVPANEKCEACQRYDTPADSDVSSCWQAGVGFRDAVSSSDESAIQAPERPAQDRKTIG